MSDSYNPFSTDPKIVNFIQDAEGLTLKQRTQNLIDMYRDNWEHIISYELSRQYTERSYKKLFPLVTTELNLLKMIIDQTALVYKEPAQRKALLGEGESLKEDETYKEILESMPINQAMKSIDTYNKLCNQTILKVVWRDGGLDYDVINFNTATVYTDERDWRRVIAVKYSMDCELPDFDNADRSHMGAEVDGVKMEKFSRSFLWTIEDDKSYVREYIQDRNGKHELVKKEDNPYKDVNGNPILPFVVFTRKYPDTALLDWTSGNDLIDGNVGTAINMIHLNRLLKFQSHKQVVITAGSEAAIPKDATMDANSAYKIADPSGQASLSTLDMQAASDKIWDIIKNRAVALLQTRGIPAGSFTITGSPQSGYAMSLDRHALLEQRQNDIELYRFKEKELFDVTRIVNNVHNVKKIDVKARFKIDYGEITFPVSDKEQAESDTINMVNNIITPIDILMRENPDLTEDEAAAKYAANKEINKQGEIVQPFAIQQPATAEVIEDDA